MSVKEIFILLDAMKKRPNVAGFIISVLFLVVMLLDLQGAVVSKDYLPTTGEICNIERHREYEGRHKVTRYDYDVVWEMDGTEMICGMTALLFLLTILFSAYVLYQQGMLQSMTIYQMLTFVVYAVSFAISFGIFIYAYRKTDC